MPQAKRERRERTDNYHLLQQWCRTPEQRLYEGIRPVVLFGIPPAERARETGLAERSLGRAADAFDTHGIISLFRPTKAQREDHHRSLPVAMRQLIVDLKAEYADFTDGEIAAICAIQFNGRRPSHHTVKAVLADGPPPQRTQRQFPRYEEIGSPEERRQAVIRLYAQGWSISTIARYLDVSRPTIYEILKRWVEEGVQWCLDIRYIEKHHIPEIKGSFYVITVMDAFSRAILASDIFQSQDLSCVLIVLYAATERFGAPQKLITDNGGVFRAKQLLAICEALDIEKEYIHARQSWENLVETHFNVMRRMSQVHFEQVTSWQGAKQAHERFVTDYDAQPLAPARARLPPRGGGSPHPPRPPWPPGRAATPFGPRSDRGCR